MDESAKCLTVLLILMDPEFYPFDLDIKKKKQTKKGKKLCNVCNLFF